MTQNQLKQTAGARFRDEDENFRGPIEDYAKKLDSISIDDIENEEKEKEIRKIEKRVKQIRKDLGILDREWDIYLEFEKIASKRNYKALRENVILKRLNRKYGLIKKHPDFREYYIKPLKEVLGG